MVFHGLFTKFNGEKREYSGRVDRAASRNTGRVVRADKNSDNEKMNEPKEPTKLSSVKEFEVKEKPCKDPTEGVNLGNGVALDDLDGYEGDWEPEANPTTSRKLKKKNVIHPQALKAIGAITKFNEKEKKTVDPLINSGVTDNLKERQAIQWRIERELFIEKVMQQTKRVMSFEDWMDEHEHLYGTIRGNDLEDESENENHATQVPPEAPIVVNELLSSQPSTSRVNPNRILDDPFWGPRAEVTKRRVSESELIEMKDINVERDNLRKASNRTENKDFHEALTGPGTGWSYGSSSPDPLCIEFPPIYPPGPIVLEHPLIMEKWTNIPGCPCRIVFNNRINSLFGNRNTNSRDVETFGEALALHNEPEPSDVEREEARLNEEALFTLLNEVHEQRNTEFYNSQVDLISENGETSSDEEVDVTTVTSMNTQHIQRAKDRLNEVWNRLEIVCDIDASIWLGQQVHTALNELDQITGLTEGTRSPIFRYLADASTGETSSDDSESESESGSSENETDGSSGSENESDESEHEETVDERLAFARTARQVMLQRFRTYVQLTHRMQNDLAFPFEFDGYFEEQADEENQLDQEGNESSDYSEYSVPSTDDENEDNESRRASLRMIELLEDYNTMRMNGLSNDRPTIMYEYINNRSPIEYERDMRRIEEQNAGILNQWKENGVAVETLKSKLICKLCNVDQMHFMCETCQQAMCISCERNIAEHLLPGSSTQCPFCRTEPTSGKFTCIRLPRL